VEWPAYDPEQQGYIVQQDGYHPMALEDLLVALPANAEWVPGYGRFGRLISNLLDERCPFIEEMPPPAGDEPFVWMVRLTEKGVEQRSITEARRVMASMIWILDPGDGGGFRA
jgi:hypothetical protein